MALSSKLRFELSFNSKEELKKQVSTISSTSLPPCYLLVNTNKNDDISGWITTIKQVQPKAHICAQYNLKCNEAGRNKSTTRNYYNFRTFFVTIRANDILLIDGHNPTKDWTAVEALQTLRRDGTAKKFSVVYNPFQPNVQAHNREMDRLKHIFNTGLVSKVFVQYGTSVDLMRITLEFLSQFRHIKVAGTIRIPFDMSREFTLDLLRLYRSFNVEVLVKSKGMLTIKGVNEINSLMEEATGITGGSMNNKSFIPKQVTPVKTNAKLNVSSKKQKIHSSEKHTVLEHTAIVLFGSHDVRIRDNRALLEACRSHCKILPVFMWEPNNQGEWGVIGALQVILKDALQHLERSLNDFGLQLYCQNSEDMVDDLVLLSRKTRASAVYYNREFIPESRKRELLMTRALGDLGVKVKEYQSMLLYNVEEIRYKPEDYGGYWGTVMYYVITARSQHGTPVRPIGWHDTLRALKRVKSLEAASYGGIGVRDLKMAEMPPKTKWDKPILDRFCMSEESAMERLEYFMEKGLELYQTERSRADLEYVTSQLSAHLRIGVLSPNEMYWRAEDSELDKSKKKVFSRRLFWRDLSYHQLYHFPEMRDKSIRVHYEEMDWVTGDEAARRLSAWKRGKTGYPIVDAGMRELYRTGWVTQSVRIIIASFLIEYLRVHWVKGAEWFHYTLVDADSAINPMMWQNAGQSGADQWNFLPSPFSGTQDKSGDYTRKWVPELAKLPLEHLHRPWKAPGDVLTKFGVVLGETYPNRIISDLREQRTKSLKSIRAVRQNNCSYVHGNGSDIIQLRNGMRTLAFTRKELRIDVLKRQPRRSQFNTSNLVELDDEERDDY